MPPEDELDRLHKDLGFRRLSYAWAKCEIVLGLAGAGGGLLYGVHVAGRAAPDLWGLTGSLALFVFGGYLALAGHRSHLYQSNNRLASYLAGLIRRQTPSGPDHEHSG